MNRLLFFLALLTPSLLQAQSLSIEDLWTRLDKNNSIQQKRIELQLAQQEALIERLNRYPIIYADATIQRNLIVPTTPVPAIAFNPSADEGAYIPLKFATQWNNKAGVHLEWDVFSPKQKLQEEKKNIAKAKAVLQELQSTEQLKKEATLAYASIVLATLQYQASLDDSARYQKVVEITALRQSEGRESFDQLLNANKDLERKKIQIYESWSVLKEANLELTKYIDLHNTESLSTSIDDLLVKLKSFQNINYEENIIQQDLISNQVDYLMIKKQLLPTLSLNGYYGAQYFNNSMNIFNSKSWYGNSFINLTLKAPISDYVIQHKYLQKNLLETDLNNLKLEQSKKEDEIKLSQQAVKIKAASLKIQSLKNILNMTEESIKNKKENYEAGRLLLSDYKQTLVDYNSNLRDLWQAQYDLISLMIN